MGKYSRDINHNNFGGDYEDVDIKCKRKSDDTTCKDCNTYSLGGKSADSVMPTYAIYISYDPRAKILTKYVMDLLLIKIGT